MQKIVLASQNAKKIKELQTLLGDLGDFEIVPQSAFNIPEAAEPFDTFLENALAKARHAAKFSGLPALADDSGLCVSALQNAPGVHSARFAGEPKSDARNNQKLLELLKNEKNRRAFFVRRGFVAQFGFFKKNCRRWECGKKLPAICGTLKRKKRGIFPRHSERGKCGALGAPKRRARIYRANFGAVLCEK